MAVTIRLSRNGAKKKPHYHIVVTDSRSPRDGKFLQKLGYYNPLSAKDSDKRFVLDRATLDSWITKGATISDTLTRLCLQHSISLPDRVLNLYNRKKRDGVKKLKEVAKVEGQPEEVATQVETNTTQNETEVSEETKASTEAVETETTDTTETEKPAEAEITEVPEETKDSAETV